MDEQMTKARFLETMRSERDAWEALLSEVGAERMEQAGAEGEWSVKEIIIHVMAWEQYAAVLLDGALRGEKPARVELYGSVIPREIEESEGSGEFNAWVVANNRDRPLDRILADSRAAFRLLYEATERCTESDLTDPERAFPGLELSTPKPLWIILSYQSYVHYRYHAQRIRDWLASRA